MVFAGVGKPLKKPSFLFSVLNLASLNAELSVIIKPIKGISDERIEPIESECVSLSIL